MASGFGLSTKPLLRRLLFKAPSSRYVTESVRCPAMLKLVPPAPVVFPATPGITPGASKAKLITLRPFSGASWICVALTTEPVVAEMVSTPVGTASTCTVSVTAPTSSFKSTFSD